MTTLTETDVEQAALEWLAALGWQTAHGPDIAPGTPSAERADYGHVVLERRLRDALARLNPELPDSAVDDALRKLTRPEGAALETRNREFHRMLVNGVNVEYRAGDGGIRGQQAQASTSAIRATTTGWRSTSSRSPIQWAGTGVPAAPMSSCSSTACPWG